MVLPCASTAAPLPLPCQTADGVGPAASTGAGSGPSTPGAPRFSVTIETSGPMFEGPHVSALLKAAVLKGLLPALPGLEGEVDPDAVNLVNAGACMQAWGSTLTAALASSRSCLPCAALVAEESGISATVAQLPPAASDTYANLLRVTLVARGIHSVVSGSVIGSEPRVVQMGLWKVGAASE